MLNNDLLLQLANKVDFINIQNYAKATGWSRINNIPDGIAIYRRPECELDEILIPQDYTFADYTRRIADAISILAEFEQRSFIEVLNDLFLPQSKKEPLGYLFIGRIDALNGKLGVDGHPQGEVTFTFLAEDEILKAKIDLLPNDYARACDAHKCTQFVELHGVLHRGTRIHRISDYKQFSVRDNK